MPGGDPITPGVGPVTPDGDPIPPYGYPITPGSVITEAATLKSAVRPDWRKQGAMPSPSALQADSVPLIRSDRCPRKQTTVRRESPPPPHPPPPLHPHPQPCCNAGLVFRTQGL